MNRIERIFNGYALLAINAGLAVACFTVGGGTYFYSSGLVHLFALGFIVLASSRLWTRKFLSDPALQGFVTAAMFGMLIFSISHVAEFAGYRLLHQAEDATFAQVVNLYAISLLALIIGADGLLRIGRKASVTRLASWIGIAIALALSLLTLFRDKGVSLDPDSSAIPWLYAGIILVITVAALLTLRAMARRVAVIAPFVNHVMLACILIMLATLPNIFYDGFETNVGLARYQIVYLSHFGFYFALSMLFIAFAKLRNLGGIFDELAAATAQGDAHELARSTE